MEESVEENVYEAVEGHLSAAKTLYHNKQLMKQIAKAAELIIACYASGGKIITAGNGGSSCQADHFAEELVARYKMNRPAIPAISCTLPGTITCAGNDFGFDSIFSRQVEAYGQEGDIFYGLTTSGNSPNILKAVEAAHKQGLKIIILSGGDGGKVLRHRDKIDHLIVCPGVGSARIQELHITIIHMHCDILEKALYGDSK